MAFFTQKKFLQFTLIAYLFQITFLLSLSQCFYFLTFFSRSSNLTLFGYLSFLLVIILAFFNEQFKKFYINLIFNNLTISLAFKLKDILTLAQKKHFNLCFVLFHLYIALSVFHLMTHFFYQMEIPFEIAYQLLNILRLVFFPLFLLGIISTFFPNYLFMETLIGEASGKAVAQITSQLLEFLKDCGNLKKNPKSAGFIYVAGATTLIAASHKSNLQHQYQATTQKFGLDVAEVPPHLLNDPEASTLYKSLLNTISLIDQPSIAVLASDIQNFLLRNPTLRTKLAEDLVSFQAISAFSQTKKQESIERANSIGMSPVARASTQDEFEAASSVVSKVPTVLEKLFFYQ